MTASATQGRTLAESAENLLLQHDLESAKVVTVTEVSPHFSDEILVVATCYR